MILVLTESPFGSPEEELGMNAFEVQPQAGVAAHRRGPARLVLILLALPQLVIGVWALVAPRDWFATFPGAGKQWLPLFGPYNEHLATDVGATFLALGVLLVLAAVWMERRLVQAAAIAYLVYQLPHTVYHLTSDDPMSTGDEILNGVLLGAATLAAAWLLFAGRTTRKPTAAPPSGSGNAHDGAVGRLRSRRRGPLARITAWYGRHRFGQAPAPGDAYLLHPRLLLGYATFETATERSGKVDERLKLLAELKVATMVRCAWCMDFGSRLSHDHGVPERKLRELHRYRDSDAFTAPEQLALDYAGAMSRTPAQVDDELFAQLREHFDDPQLVELTNAIALENHRARFNIALGLDAQGFSQGSFCILPDPRPSQQASRASKLAWS
jgi:alkylhydroperoxidase family enzyme